MIIGDNTHIFYEGGFPLRSDGRRIYKLEAANTLKQKFDSH